MFKWSVARFLFGMVLLVFLGFVVLVIFAVVCGFGKGCQFGMQFVDLGVYGWMLMLHLVSWFLGFWV